MFDKILLCRDLWTLVLSYFEVSLDDDEDQVIGEKRRSILAIALLSPELTELSLNALWKNMTTLNPIVNVANSDGVFFEHHTFRSNKDGGGCWRISPDSKMTPKLISKLINSLKRIRNIHVEIDTEELNLWHILHTILAPHSMAYLLPCLQNLTIISWSLEIYPFLGVISYVFPPSLVSITVNGEWGSSWNTVQYFMNMHAFPNLDQLSYLDSTLENIPRGIERLVGLRSLVLYEEDGEYSDYRLEDFESLASLCRLRKLTISIGHDRDGGVAESNLTGNLFTFRELQELQLEIDTPELLAVCIQRIKLPSLTSLSLSMKWSQVQKPGLESIVSMYPNLLHLTLRCPHQKAHPYKLTIDDLILIIDGCGLNTLRLVDVPHELKKKDIFSLMGLLPNLHTLAITDPTIIFSDIVLISICLHPNLRHIELPLAFSDLLSALPSEKTFRHPSRISNIVSPRSVGIPEKAAGKVVLVRNLLHLFPNLEEFSLGGAVASEEELRDLLELLRKDLFYRPRV